MRQDIKEKVDLIEEDEDPDQFIDEMGLDE